MNILKQWISEFKNSITDLDHLNHILLQTRPQLTLFFHYYPYPHTKFMSGNELDWMDLGLYAHNKNAGLPLRVAAINKKPNLEI